MLTSRCCPFPNPCAHPCARCLPPQDPVSTGIVLLPSDLHVDNHKIDFTAGGENPMRVGGRGPQGWACWAGGEVG